MSVLAFRKLEKLLAESPDRVGWNDVRIDPYGIVWATETAEEYMSWLGISDVVETDGSIWLKTGEAQGFFLPGRIFETEANLRECLSIIEQYRENPRPPRHQNSNVDDALVRH